MIDLVLLSLAAFWLTHMHVILVQRYKVSLPVKQWEFCYHCIGFWYALILFFIGSIYLNIAISIFALVFILRAVIERVSYG